LGLKDKELFPKYPSPIRKPLNQVYEIRNTADPKIGFGMFATRDIQLGDLIMCERPLLFFPSLLYKSITTTFFPPLKKSDQKAYESILGSFFERVCKDNQDEYLKSSP
jgi:hypothetical protein